MSRTPRIRRLPRRMHVLAATWLALLMAGCGGGDARRPRGSSDSGAGGDGSRPTSGETATSSAAAAGTAAAAPTPESVAADSAALSELPPALAPALHVERYLTDRYIAATPGAECLVQSPPGSAEARRRVHVRLPDRSALVVFARVDTARHAVHRVEFMRNPVGAEQVAVTLDGEGDVATVIRWPDRGRGKPESAVHPRGGPLPRALRFFAHRLWTLKCPAQGPEA